MFRLAEDVEWSPGKAGNCPESAAALSQEESKKEGKKVSFFREEDGRHRRSNGTGADQYQEHSGCVCVRAIPLANGTCGDGGGNWSRQVNIKVESVNPERRRRRK